MDIKEIEIKRNKLLKLIEIKNISGILLSKKCNFRWLTGGHDNNVIRTEDSPLVYLYIDKSGNYIIATKSDADRVFNEELNGLGFQLILYNWYDENIEDVIKNISGNSFIGCDYSNNSFMNLEYNLTKLRIDLTDCEVNVIKEFSKNYSNMLTDFCLKLKAGLTEKEIADDLEHFFKSYNINFPVLMVGSDDRIYKFRHPIATNKKVKKYLLIATVAELYGLHISISRSVYFGKANVELQKKQEIVNFLEAKLCFNSLPGIMLKDLFEIAKNFYKELKYPDEWQNHTFGGIVGYRPREFLIDALNTVKINKNNIISWNPTISGAKAEDVILVEKNKVIQLTIDKRWPCSEYHVDNMIFFKPRILEL